MSETTTVKEPHFPPVDPIVPVAWVYDTILEAQDALEDWLKENAPPDIQKLYEAIHWSHIYWEHATTIGHGKVIDDLNNNIMVAIPIMLRAIVPNR